jgi:hypothetical protein
VFDFTKGAEGKFFLIIMQTSRVFSSSFHQRRELIHFKASALDLHLVSVSKASFTNKEQRIPPPALIIKIKSRGGGRKHCS